jgi:hypothetical protein
MFILTLPIKTSIDFFLQQEAGQAPFLALPFLLLIDREISVGPI